MRTPGGTGLQCFSARTLFFPPKGCTLSFRSLLSSHSGTGSLTAAATELDGFYLLWLEKTLFMLWTPTHTHTHMFCKMYLYSWSQKLARAKQTYFKCIHKYVQSCECNRRCQPAGGAVPYYILGHCSTCWLMLH